jgi:uridine phosphorylase
MPDIPQIPLMEFDAERQALIEPARRRHDIDLPVHCVLPMYNSVIDKLKNEGKLEQVYSFKTPFVSLDVFKLVYEDVPVTVVHPGIGAPFAVGTLERLIPLGCLKFVACGSAGVLDPALKWGALVIPDAAVRDEGTSYHYQSPSRCIEIEPGVVAKLQEILDGHHLEYRTGKTWTTDAFFRETKARISRRKNEGCLTVEMECSALIAAARFRGVTFGQYLVVGDDVSGDEWDPRYVENSLPAEEKVFWLSVEACLTL